MDVHREFLDVVLDLVPRHVLLLDSRPVVIVHYFFLQPDHFVELFLFHICFGQDFFDVVLNLTLVILGRLEDEGCQLLDGLDYHTVEIVQHASSHHEQACGRRHKYSEEELVRVLIDEESRGIRVNGL